MGGNSKSTAPASTATTPVTQPTMTVQPFMPGMQQALADQLAAGYGQQPADLMTYLSSIYKPMQVPDYSQGYKPPTTAPTTPTTNVQTDKGAPLKNRIRYDKWS